MASKDQRRVRGTAARHGADHLAARREHAAWLGDLERWRREYRQAIAAFARRVAPELALENYEAALDRHEAAIQAHEELIRHHEQALEAEDKLGSGLAADYPALHEQLGARHARSRAVHLQLERTHAAVVAALELLSRSR